MCTSGSQATGVLEAMRVFWGKIIYTSYLTIFPRLLPWLLFQIRYCTKWTHGLTPQNHPSGLWRCRTNKVELTQHSNTHVSFVFLKNPEELLYKSAGLFRISVDNGTRAAQGKRHEQGPAGNSWEKLCSDCGQLYNWHATISAKADTLHYGA